jgi:hypothetical protein
MGKQDITAPPNSAAVGLEARQTPCITAEKQPLTAFRMLSEAVVKVRPETA